MKLTILGSGTVTLRLERNMAGYLLEADGKKILFDAGPGTVLQLLKLKINLLDIDHMLFTHLHNDHIHDLAAIIFCSNFGLFRKNPLHVYGPKGFKKYLGDILRLTIGKKLEFKLNVKEMAGSPSIKISMNNNSEKITMKKEHTKAMDRSINKSINKENSKNNILIKSIKAIHTDSSISYRIECNGRILVYSGDTDYSENIIKISKDADLLVLECANLDSNKKPGHLTPSLCGKIATKANAKKIVLTHLNPECGKADIKKRCSKEFRGKVVVARDLMGIEI